MLGEQLTTGRPPRTITLGPVVAGVAAVIAAVSALPDAGGWNDGSRLATVESLVDYRTLRIDDSVFVQPSAAPHSPYPDEPLLRDGTKDKLLIDGHYYSDKSPVPALWL